MLIFRKPLELLSRKSDIAEDLRTANHEAYIEKAGNYAKKKALEQWDATHETLYPFCVVIFKNSDEIVSYEVDPERFNFDRDEILKFYKLKLEKLVKTDPNFEIGMLNYETKPSKEVEGETVYGENVFLSRVFSSYSSFYNGYFMVEIRHNNYHNVSFDMSTIQYLKP